MKTILTAVSMFVALGISQSTQAQSTTGGKSGGSTASTGSGYLTDGKRPTTSDASSMTIADEGASRAYMYVPPTAPKNRSASPDGSGSPKMKKQTSPDSTATKPRSVKPKRTGN
ncbi:hypothetical protein [Spirosoma agri]|uniref:Uncharacterized protein n=1 Tax=Spirosoma agri TaxID=1987381 RepID=A0A6M0IK03_9BACT|nr:hypothetical protein [Spirosoma agri]NEU67711.1 hypothetical protein [Spirosoma agri]